MDVVERRWTSAVNRLLQQPELAEAPAEPLLGDFEGGGHGRDVVAEAADGGFEVVSREGGGSLKARALLHQVIDRGPRDAEAAGGGMRPEAGGLEGGEELVLGHVRGLARLCLDGDRWGRSWARRCRRGVAASCRASSSAGSRRASLRPRLAITSWRTTLRSWRTLPGQEWRARRATSGAG